MKLSNEKILTDINNLREIAKRELPVKAAYAIAKNITKFEAELKTYEKERFKLIEKYAEKKEDGTPDFDEAENIIFKEEHKKDWSRDIKELLSIENEIEIHTFPIQALEGRSISAAELMFIDYMIEG